jgi:hypothetical protein
MIGIFHFGFRQRGSAGGAPVNRFFSFINTAVEIKLPKFLNRDRFVRIGHRQIRILPLAENTETLELFTLNVDIFFRIGPAGAALFHLRHRPLFGAQFLIHLMLNRQAVTIPARHIDTVKSGHVF